PPSRGERAFKWVEAGKLEKICPPVHLPSAPASNGTSRVGSIRRQRTRRKTKQRADTHHVRDHRLYRTQGRRPGSDRRTTAAGISRLRFGGRRRRAQRPGRVASERRQ